MVRIPIQRLTLDQAGKRWWWVGAAWQHRRGTETESKDLADQ